jgi:hypothetical protein
MIYIHLGDKWGDYATWALVVTTFLAIIAAIVASKLAYRIETERDQAARRKALWSQAEQISGWIQGVPLKNPDPNRPDEFLPSVVAIVRNPSMQSIRNVVMIWRFQGKGQSTSRVDAIQPNSFKTFEIPRHLLNLLVQVDNPQVANTDGNLSEEDYENIPEFVPPEVNVNLSQYELAASKDSEKISPYYSLIFDFTDVQRNRWRRDEDGFLKPMFEIPNAPSWRGRFKKEGKSKTILVSSSDQ